jgi:hypothetical protein
MDPPEVYRIQRRIPDRAVLDPRKALGRAVEQSGVLEAIDSGSTVVIAAGSRGIANYAVVIKTLVGLVEARGASAVILPAMGSNGGGDGPAQVQVLAELGITPQSVGAPVVETMQVEQIGTTESGIPVYADRILISADQVILVNRVKEHTEFHGRIESGLLKMMAIGLGRYAGAVATHSYAVQYGYERTIREVARIGMDKLPILAGVAMLEGPGNDTMLIEVVGPAEMEAAEERLLSVVRRSSLKLPLDTIDVLIVDEMGKNISGTGMDTKVIGRIMNIYEKELTSPHITRIMVRDLTPETRGNAIGIGLADFTTQRLVEKIDFQVTNLNCIAAVTPEKARIPMVFPDDRQALAAAMNTVGPKDAGSVRLVWVRNTSALVDLMVSTAACAAIDPQAIDTAQGPMELKFDCAGDLIAPWLEEDLEGVNG